MIIKRYSLYLLKKELLKQKTLLNKFINNKRR